MPYNHYLYIVERAKIKGVEDELGRRIARLCGIFVAHKVGKLGKVRLLKLSLQTLVPRRFHLYIHIKQELK